MINVVNCPHQKQSKHAYVQHKVEMSYFKNQILLQNWNHIVFLVDFLMLTAYC
jgi:hypothetical protein